MSSRLRLSVSSSIPSRLKPLHRFSSLVNTIIKKGKKIPDYAFYKHHAQNLVNVFSHQWVLAALFYRQSGSPLGTQLYHSALGLKSLLPFY
jgi:hypothetical protein